MDGVGKIHALIILSSAKKSAWSVSSDRLDRTAASRLRATISIASVRRACALSYFLASD
jgi:hypothetical protein